MKNEIIIDLSTTEKKSETLHKVPDWITIAMLLKEIYIYIFSSSQSSASMGGLRG